MVRLVRIEDLKPFGYLDDPKCRGPLEPGTSVKFEMWRRGEDLFYEDPGPLSGVRYPPKLHHGVFSVAVVRIDNEICLMIEGRDEEFFRKHRGFRPV